MYFTFNFVINLMLRKDMSDFEQPIPKVITSLAKSLLVINVLFSHNKDESKGVQFTVLNDRSQGGSSLLDGSMELMVNNARLTHQ